MASSGSKSGVPPGPRPDASRPVAAPCVRCGHRPDLHLHPGSCSARGPWWRLRRHCRCSGYIRLESADHSPGARPPAFRATSAGSPGGRSAVRLAARTRGPTLRSVHVWSTEYLVEPLGDLGLNRA
jgi:hypothetical protein